MTEVSYKQGDTVPLEAVLPIDSDEDLDDATTVQFHMNDQDGSNVIESTAVIVDGPSGVVQYQWSGSETDRTGVYEIEWEVEWSAGQFETYPRDGTDRIFFEKELA